MPWARIETNLLAVLCLPLSKDPVCLRRLVPARFLQGSDTCMVCQGSKAVGEGPLRAKTYVISLQANQM